MEIGPEISNKIRSAIKAKLVELGAYVDEELPDYIMVMVANKKTRLQMTEDLSLFLGGNTDKFTVWLHSLITKLQSISNESLFDGNQEEKKDKEKVERKKSTEKKKIGPSETSAEQPKKKTDKSTVVGKDPSKVKPVKPKEPVVEKQPSSVAEPEEPEFTVRADTDEFTEELKEIEKLAEAKKAAAAPPTSQPIPSSAAPVRVSAPAPSVSSQSSAVTREKYVPRPAASMVSRLGEKKTVPHTETRLGGRCVVSSDKQSSTAGRTAVLKSSTVSLKRKAPSSVVKPVAKTVEDEEEEYDPHNPSVGNVASVVRVTARKSSVPRSLQANKTLLMKAMTDAEKSITTGSKRSITVSNNRQERGHPRSLYSDSLGKVMVDTSRPRYNPLQLGLTSRSKKEEIMRRMKYTIAVESPDGNTEEIGSEDELNLVSDNRVVEVHPEDEEEEETSSSEIVVATAFDSDVGEVVEAVEGEPEEGEAIPLILEEEAADEFRHVLEEEEQQQAIKTTPDKGLQQRQQHHPQLPGQEGEENEVGNLRVVKENPKNTKFIVTLDGVDPDQYESMEVDMEEADKSERVSEVLSHVTPPKIKSFSINLKDSDDEDDSTITPLKRAKMTEKCRYWPACVNGNSCEYHHPTVPCKTFPSCKFGDKCLYIHPNCKYDARCTKTDCPFTHASRRKPVPISPPQVIAIPQPKVIVAAPPAPPPPTHPRQITCKFYPNCHNMKCPFKHPKPCRYGLGCGKWPACPFFHPALPTKDQLTWKSNKPGQSGTPNSDGIKAS